MTPEYDQSNGFVRGAWFSILLPSGLDPVPSADGSVMIVPSELSIQIEAGSSKFNIVCRGKRATAGGDQWQKGKMHQTTAAYAQRVADPWLAQIAERWGGGLDEWLPTPEVPPAALTGDEKVQLSNLRAMFGDAVAKWPDEVRDRADELGLLRHEATE